jgi:ABC-type sugar transport system substrate-binding protein
MFVFLLVFVVGVSLGAQEKKYEIVMVAKHEGIAWFDDMRAGVEASGKNILM